MKTLILGIDPGVSGAIAVIRISDGGLEHSFDMPVVTEKKTRRINADALALLMDAYLPFTRFAMVENVHAMPGQGVVSMFTFGYAAGIARGILAANYVPVFLVEPSVWKAGTGLSSSKTESLLMARRFFGEKLFPLKKDHGQAEAALIARFGWLKIQKI